MQAKTVGAIAGYLMLGLTAVNSASYLAAKEAMSSGRPVQELEDTFWQNYQHLAFPNKIIALAGRPGAKIAYAKE